MPDGQHDDDGGPFAARYAVPADVLPPPYHPDVRAPVPAAAVAGLACGVCGLAAVVLPAVVGQALVGPALLVSALGVVLSVLAARRGQGLAVVAAVVSGGALLVALGSAVVVLAVALLG